MSNEYYSLATLEHFWIQRRFEVLLRMAADSVQLATAIADIGCGHGILQRQIEDRFQQEVTGFDLNEGALKQTASRMSPVCCYDMFQRNSEFRGRFDLVLLFDVLEHVPEEQAFLNAIKFHMAPNGKLVINVPALESLWSKYDEATGHCRRYTIRTLRHAVQGCGMVVRAWSYWGLFLTPLLMLRKIWVSQLPNEQVYSTGFQSGNAQLNQMLLWLSRCEPIPQYMFGSSLMAVLERQPEN